MTIDKYNILMKLCSLTFGSWC